MILSRDLHIGPLKLYLSVRTLDHDTHSALDDNAALRQEIEASLSELAEGLTVALEALLARSRSTT